MPSSLDTYIQPPHIHVDGQNLIQHTYTSDYRRESSSSRSTSAIISTPLSSSENLNEMVRVASDLGTVSGGKVGSSRNVRRIGEQERTLSWAQSQHEQVGDEDRLLKPPSQEPTRRPSICTSQILRGPQLTYSIGTTSRARA
jgi:hypothetical protein